MKTARIVAWLLALSFLLSPVPLLAGQSDLPKELRSALAACAKLLAEIKPHLTEGAPDAAQVAQLGAQLETLDVIHLLLQERHREYTARAAQLGGKAAQRQAAMANSYNRSMSSLLALLAQLVQAPGQAPQLLPQVEQMLQQLLPAQQTPIHGLLPYQPVNYSKRDLVLTPTVTPAYQLAAAGGVSADLAASPEAPISPLISDQAKAIALAAGRQNWDPVALYEWVKNNVRTEWYHGCMKGAEETLRQKCGNDADQAALLVALLRASGYPARYVRGVVEFFPGLAAIKAQTGIDDPAAIGTFFRKAGIPYEPVMNGAAIINYRVEHVWVEALVPYANYRGALADSQGQLWLPLDTSFKVAGYQETGSIDLYSEPGNPLSTLRDSYLAGSQTLTPLERLQQEVATFLTVVATGTTYADARHARTLRQEVLRILPSAPQFTEVAVTGEYASLPAELIHTVRLRATSPAPASQPVFDVTLPTHGLSNRKIAVSFEPETVEDQEIINTWGGLDNTPGYLVRLRPVLLIDNERILVGQEGFPSGGSFDLSVELTSPSGTAAVTNTLLAGYPAVLGLVAQDTVRPDPASLRAEATDLLYREALNYIDRWNQGEKELAELLNLRTIRPLPTLVALGGAVEVVELLGVPQGVAWKGLFLDADLRAVETVVRTLAVDERQQRFLQLSALQGSVLEGRLFEDAFGVESISTVKLFGLAGDRAVGILTIDAANAAAVVPTLPVADNVKVDIAAAAAQGLIIKIPAQAVTFQDWSGIGYLKEDPVTGAAGYMLSGQIAGGMTAVSPGSWVYAWVYAFESPYAETSNQNPLAAHSIHKLGGSDFQVGAAGEELPEPLAVLVRDSQGRPVAGAPVTFTIQRGGGTFANGAQTITATTDRKGIARTVPNLKLGSYIQAEATTYAEADYQYASFARQNTVTAQLANTIALLQPFVATAIPGLPTQLVPIGGIQITGDILQYAGEIGVQVKDKYNNPVANVPIRFAVGTPIPWHNWCAVGNANQTKLLAQVAGDNTCSNTLPSWGECAVTGGDTAITMSNGVVAAGIVMGSYPDGKYPITANYAGTQTVTLPPAYFTGYTNPVAPNSTCGGRVPPSSYLSLHKEDSLHSVRPAGTQRKVRAKAEMLAEGVAAQLGTESFSCNGENLGCAQLAGNRAFDFVNPDSLQVSFNGSAGKLSTTSPDMYESNLTLAVGNNNVAVHASASRTISHYANSCSGGCAPQPTQRIDTITADWSVNYIGVAIDMPEAITVELNQYGFPIADVPVSYSILPLDYDAVSASFQIYQGDTLVYVLSTDTKGANTDIIPSHFPFDPAKQYSVQVVLNYGWNEGEVRSEKVPISSRLVDLDIDSDNNAILNQDGTHPLPARDPLEEQVEAQPQSPGKAIFANRLDVDRDKVPGFADGLDLFGNQGDGASAPFVPVLIDIDGTLDPVQVRVKLSYDASNPAAITRTGNDQAGYVYVPAPGSLRLWSKDGGVSRKVAGLAQGGDYIAPGTYSLAQLGTNIAPHTWRVYAEGIADTGQAQLIRLEVQTITGTVTTNVGADTVKVSVVNATLVPDYDHNRKIEQGDIDRAGRGDTFYFWINDDDDSGETGGDDIPGVKQYTGFYLDCENDTVDGMRDLIDFFPVVLDVSGLLRVFPAGTYKYNLVTTAENLKVVFPELTKANAGKYLTDVDTSRQLGAAASRRVRVGGIEPLSAGEETLFNTLVSKAINPDTQPVVLVEGLLAGSAPLRLTVANVQGEEVASIDLDLSLAGVEQMFRHKNLIYELSRHNEYYLIGHPISSDIGMPNRGIETNTAGFTNTTHFLGFDAENDQNNSFIHVHGFNVNDQEARGEQSEIFKRLYWSGSKAKFWGISWYGWDSQSLTAPVALNFHVNVRHAFNTGRLLKDFVAAQGLGGSTIFGHSLGNMVISSALREGMTIGRYLMVNPAVAEEAYSSRDVYDGGFDYGVGTPWRTAAKESMFHPAWRYPDGQQIELEQGYRPFLWASEWYKVFGSEDGRSNLTWRDIFTSVRNNNETYVYYTPTDEAFRPFNYTLEMAANDPAGTNYQPNVVDWPGWEDVAQNAFQVNSSGLGTYIWSIQELLKGRVSALDSNAGGWGFNLDSQDGYVFQGFHVLPGAANTYPSEQMKSKPFFSKNYGNAWLYSDQPVPVSNAVREELLANEIPALTFAAGHRGVKEIRVPKPDRDVDIRREYLIQKPDAPWPDDRLEGYDWRHSDIYVVAYPYLCSLYDGWKSLINGVRP